MPLTASQIVDLIDTAVASRLAGNVVDEYHVDGISFKYAPLDMLQSLREDYARRAAGSEIAAGSVRPFKILGIRPSRPT